MAAMLFLLSLCIIGSQAACTNPKVDFQSYSSSNALLSRENALIVEVQLSCEEELSLHGLVADQLLPVARSLGSNKYQLSWTESHAESKTGQRTIKFYDDEGTTALRKSLRYGEESSAKPMFSIEINNKGVKQDLIVGPSFIAVVIAVFIWWLAYTTKTKLQE